MSRQVYVGREHELANLADLLDDAVAGHGALALVTGEPGSGKTALVERLAGQRTDRTDRAIVRWAACWEGEGQPPYWPWTQVLRQELAAGARPLERDAAELARLAPELGAPGPGESSRFVVYDALARFLADLSAQTPRLLIVDDLQWADEASLGFLEFLAHHLSRLAMLVVATVRDTDVRPPAPLYDALPLLSRGAARIALAGLSIDDVGELLTALTGRPVEAGLATEVVLESGGNPLFATELGRLLATRGGGPLPVPSAVADVIQQRLAGLPAEGADLLRTAAVLGLRFDVAELAEVVGAEVSGVLDALGPYVEARFVTVDQDLTVRLSFTHALVRRALIEGLAPLERARRHAAVADVLERRAGSSVEHLARLADHLAAALPLVDRSRASQAAHRAGDAAVASLAFADAARRYQQALDLVDDTSPAGDAVRLDLLVTLGEAQWRAGSGPASQATAFQAAELARRVGDADAFARAALGAALHYTRYERRPDIVGVLEEALQLLPPGDSARRVQVLARLSERLPPWTDRPDECERVAHQAIAMARRLDDRNVLGLALRASQEAMHSCDTLDERGRMAEELRSLAREASDPEAAAEADRALFTVALERADRPAADRAVTGLEAAARMLRRPHWQFEHLQAQAVLALLEGRIDDGQAVRRRMAALAEWAEVAEIDIVTALQLHVAGIECEIAGYEQAVDALCDLYRYAPVLRSAVGGVAALGLVILDRRDEADQIVREVLAGVDEPVLRRFSAPGGLVLLARAAQRLGMTEGLDGLYRFLLPYQDRVGVLARRGVCTGPVAQALGIAAGQLGDTAAAVAHFARAERVATAMRARAWQARNAVELARVLAGAGDPDGAGTALATAARLGQALGMTRLLAEVDALQAGRGPARPPSPRLEPTAAASLAVDGDLWAVRMGGTTARLRDTKGLHYLAELVRHPGVERHVLDLAALTEGAPVEPGLQRRFLGDAGPMLDERAKAAYRRRLLDLREDLEEAEAFNDTERASRRRAELDALAAELSRAVGLGGRDRRAASAAERARLNVTRALRAAITRIDEAIPDLGAHLDRRVRTGVFCAYEPTPGDAIPWA